jgi:tRNA pseudouridine38-40 synthase
MRIALTLEYDGSKYHGSQIQDNVPTIQGELEVALASVTGEKVRTVFAGRTDQGVHARGQVAAFNTSSLLQPSIIAKALNYYLPEDIVTKDASTVKDDFDPRRHAESREYCYYIWNDKTPSPFSRANAYFVPNPVDVEAMNEACQCIIGAHDFVSFAGSLNGRRNTVRTVYEADVSREDALIAFSMVANAFLPHQVRHTIGALLRVGTGKMSIYEFRRYLHIKRHASAGPVAPPHGLYLMKVNYPSDVQ